MILSEEKAVELVRNILGELSEYEEDRIRKLVAMESPLASDPERLADDIRTVRRNKNRDPYEELRPLVGRNLSFWEAREIVGDLPNPEDLIEDEPELADAVGTVMTTARKPYLDAKKLAPEISREVEKHLRAAGVLIAVGKRAHDPRGEIVRSWEWTDPAGEKHEVQARFDWEIVRWSSTNDNGDTNGGGWFVRTIPHVRVDGQEI